MSNDKVAATVHPRKPCSCFARDPKMGPWHFDSCAYYQALPEETTGEHVWAKVAEDTMAAYAEADAKATMRMYETLPGKPKRGWVPTKGELAIAMGIVVFIVAIFCFIVLAY